MYVFLDIIVIIFSVEVNILCKYILFVGVDKDNKFVVLLLWFKYMIVFCFCGDLVEELKLFSLLSDV